MHLLLSLSHNSDLIQHDLDAYSIQNPISHINRLFPDLTGKFSRLARDFVDYLCLICVIEL